MSYSEGRFWEHVDVHACEGWDDGPRVGLKRPRMAQDGRWGWGESDWSCGGVIVAPERF